jgi:hypothetical protein
MKNSLGVGEWTLPEESLREEDSFPVPQALPARRHTLKKRGEAFRQYTHELAKA